MSIDLVHLKQLTDAAVAGVLSALPMVTGAPRDALLATLNALDDLEAMVDLDEADEDADEALSDIDLDAARADWGSAAIEPPPPAPRRKTELRALGAERSRAAPRPRRPEAPLPMPGDAMRQVPPPVRLHA